MPPSFAASALRVRILLGTLLFTAAGTVTIGTDAPRQVLPAIVTQISLPSVEARPLEWPGHRNLARYISDTWGKSPDKAMRIVRAAFDVGAQYDLPPALLLAIVAQESSFNAKARSSYGAVGLMQVVPRFHKDKLRQVAHPDGLYHPESNLKVGAQVLKEYLDRAGDLPKALRKYSGSATRYSERILARWRDFEKVRNQPREQPGHLG